MSKTETPRLGETRRLYAAPGFTYQFADGHPFSPLGETISLDAFWIKRLRDGSVTLTPPSAPEAETPKPADPAPAPKSEGEGRKSKKFRHPSADESDTA